MCGIFGAFGAGVEMLEGPAAVASRVLAHRGPDAAGLWTDEGILLGHRRLSIVDLDPRAHQPMHRGPLTIAYNGEIYNFVDLRRELESAGERFTTTSDTEVLLAGLERHGVAFLERTEGMFAFGLYDARDRSLLVARDRYGEKPLFVHQAPRRVTFASELAGIEALAEEPLEEDPAAIALFFRLSYVPAPRSALREVAHVEPGTWRRYDTRLACTQGRYYALPRASQVGIDYATAREAVRAKVTGSVALRLRTADVPVATLLSGGLDSTIVTLVADQVSQKPVTAYSLSFPDDPAFDEGVYASEAAARALHLDHRLVPARVADLLPFADRLFATLSEPLADASLIPTAYLMSHVSEKVVLGGDGADEIFAGYGTYAAMHVSARLPRALKALLMSLPSHGNPASIRNPALRALALFHANLAEDPVAEYLQWRSYARSDDLAALGLSIDAVDAIRQAIGDVATGALRDVQAVDIAFNLHNDMLRKVDIAGMLFGVEARLPYLDRDLVHFALSLPDDFRIKGRSRKRILRDAFSDLVPERVLTRRKMGFLMPIRSWFAEGPLRDGLLDMARSHARFDCSAIERLAAEHRRGTADHSVLLWALYVYFRWIEGRRLRATTVV